MKKYTLVKAALVILVVFIFFPLFPSEASAAWIACYDYPTYVSAYWDSYSNNYKYYDSCTTPRDYFCSGNTPVYYSSCPSWCTTGCGAPACDPYDYRSCYGGDAYWYDSCGVRDGVADYCSSCEYCSWGYCYSNCSGSDTNCGCSSCANCNSSDGCYSAYYRDYYCAGTYCTYSSTRSCSCVSCTSCQYCSSGYCYNYCSGSDTSCGCTSCSNCNSSDGCVGTTYRDYYCSGTSCTYSSSYNDSRCLKSQGETCSSGSECSSGYCEDGYCCNMACGLCKHCDYAGDLGTCYYYNTGDDPENECYGTGACGGTCNGSGSCQYPSTSVTCSALQDCDYLNYYYQDPSTDSAVGTDRCYYRDYADTYRYCNGAGSCSALNCSSYSNPYQYECGTCKYIPSNYCVGDYKGSCANWSQGGSCGTDKECDGSGNCVDCADPTGTISTSKTTVDIGEQFTITVNGYDDNDVWYLYVRENDGDWQSQQCLYTQTSCTKTWNFTKSSADTYRYYGLVMDSDDVHSCSDYHESATVPQYIDIEVVQPLSPNGDSCAIGADCQSGYCEDDVCCVNACSGTCRHCNATPGTCTYIPIGEDPDSECSGFSVCNGSGSCTTCSSLSYPTDYWQRAWYTWDGNCLGNGPNENAVQFDNNWGTNAPAYGISDNIQFQSSRSIYFADAGIYRFSLVHDDGVKLYINDNLKIDEWQAGSDTHKVDVNLTAGWHDFRIDWFEATGNARIGFSYEVSTGCPAYCASLGYTYAECYGPLCRSYDQCGDQCVDGVAYDWWDSGGQNGCWWPQKCWCRNIYSDVECGRNYIASGMSTVQSYGCGDDEDPTTGCCIKFSLFEEGGQGSTKGACGYGEPLNPTKAFAECKLGSCSSASGHNGENCTIFRNCNNEWQNSPTNFVEMDGNYYDWSLATEYVGGKWDASNKQCVKCSGNKKTHKYGDTTTLSYVTCFETISPSGDIPDVCESACGADPDCDEKNTGDSCDTGKTCNSTCQCVSSDISPPEVTITGPTTHQKDDFTITINYSDNQAGDSGLATCLYQIRRGGVVVYPTVGDWTSAGNCADKSSDGYNKNIPVGPTEYCREPAGGGCEVRTYVIDNAGKDGGDVQIFNIDYTPPETEIY